MKPMTNQFDFTKMFQQFNPQEMTKKLQESFNLDLSVVNEAQSKNMQALMGANKAFAEGAKAVFEKQSEMFQAAINDANETAQAMTGSPQDVANKQAEVMKLAYETALKNTAEIGEMAKQTQEQMAEKINLRVTESVAELKDAMSKIS
jgi:phasin family protein